MHCVAIVPAKLMLSPNRSPNTSQEYVIYNILVVRLQYTMVKTKHYLSRNILKHNSRKFSLAVAALQVLTARGQ